MTYNQVQSFQINDYANHYVDIKITGYRVLYSKSIAGRGIARLISWCTQQGRLTALKGVFDCYIRVYRSFSIFAGRVQPNFWLGLPSAMPLKQGIQLIFKILEVYSRDHTCQLEYSKQYSMIESYYRLSTSTHKANLLKVVTKNNV